ncbi:hypothetical protein AFM11_04455 [Mycolicibacterium wolinskyi]|uniref:Uncharacterized protein n=1 Tax=Mycolicibacterium wolinskyi TaxID=59750 RepID=A0A132PTR7_9MYCO|nr:hypothetical protein [Mycolicibacterium wolinskyi]KWX25705.1 hypothetical protein AFM11_04455 [Mycolicibacterium wolinskyi]
MADRRLAFAGLAFGVLALVAGSLQLWAFVDTDRPRHVVVAVFALSVGGSVVVAAARSLWRK